MFYSFHSFSVFFYYILFNKNIRLLCTQAILANNALFIKQKKQMNIPVLGKRPALCLRKTNFSIHLPLLSCLDRASISFSPGLFLAFSQPNSRASTTSGGKRHTCQLPDSLPAAASIYLFAEDVAKKKKSR